MRQAEPAVGDGEIVLTGDVPSLPSHLEIRELPADGRVDPGRRYVVCDGHGVLSFGFRLAGSGWAGSHRRGKRLMVRSDVFGVAFGHLVADQRDHISPEIDRVVIDVVAACGQDPNCLLYTSDAADEE